MITLEGGRRGLSIFLVFGVSVPSLTVLLREGDYGSFIISFFDLKPTITYSNLYYRINKNSCSVSECKNICQFDSSIGWNWKLLRDQASVWRNLTVSLILLWVWVPYILPCPSFLKNEALVGHLVLRWQKLEAVAREVFVCMIYRARLLWSAYTVKSLWEWLFCSYQTIIWLYRISDEEMK